MEGSKFIERPGIWHEQKLEAQERIMALIIKDNGQKKTSEGEAA